MPNRRKVIIITYESVGRYTKINNILVLLEVNMFFVVTNKKT